MSTALNRQEKSEKIINLQTTYEPKYQTYTEITPQQWQLEDVFFFARVATFAISTVLICFIFLVQNFSTFWAFTLALILSSGLVYGLSKGLNHLFNEAN